MGEVARTTHPAPVTRRPCRRPGTGRAGNRDLGAFQHIDDCRAYLCIATDYAVIVAAGVAAAWIDRAAVTVLALVIIAGRQSALQGLVHSACHYSLFSRRQHNDALEFLYAYPILDSVRLYRRQHLEHHRDFERRTPDRFDYILDTLQLSRRGVRARTWVVFIRPLLGHAGWVFLSDVVETCRDDRRAAGALLTYWAALVATAWLGGFLWSFVLYWVIPLVWLYPVLDIWAELSDHLDARGESRNQDGVFYSLLLKGHETYHAVHHQFPRVPFYRLAALRDHLRERGVVMEHSRGPLDFLRIVFGAARPRPAGAAPDGGLTWTQPS